jgi:hypothetical protein
MGDGMIIGLDALGRPAVAEGACHQQASVAPVKLRHRRRFGLRTFLMVWAAISVLWIAGASYDIYQRIDEQADMSVDVERDLDQGLTPASCSGQCLSGGLAGALSDRFEIASTFFKFGSVEMGECVLGPPAALLLVGLGIFSAFRRRRRAM